MSRFEYTVGSLRGIPQGHVGRGGIVRRRDGAAPPLPPSKRGKGCCKRMCAGCPWAESVRRRAHGGRQPTRAEPPPAPAVATPGTAGA